MDQFPYTNRTFQILHAAAKGSYAVGAFCVYNDDGIMAVIRAAEQCRSPAIIQLFPWTIRFQGPHFIRYAVDAAHAASVPIAVQLDHCIEHEDIEAALELPFDSIMIDASLKDAEESIAQCKRVVERARSKGITIEAELGRMEGGEDGLPTVELESIMTRPEQAREFVERTGVHFVAPSFGNVHGNYGPGGPEKSWNLALARKVCDIVPGNILALHGTHGVSNGLFLDARLHGFTKINLNKTIRDDYTRFIAEEAGRLQLTELKKRGVQIYTRSIVSAMQDFLGSAGKVL